MQALLFDQILSKRLKKRFFIFAILCVAVISVLYTPVYLLLSSNVMWRNSIVLLLWTEIFGPLMNYTFYWGSFAFLIYAYLRFSQKGIKPFLIIYGVAVVSRYLVTMLSTFAIMAFPGWDALWSRELPGVLFSIVMDGLQMLGVLLLSEFCAHRPLLQKNPHICEHNRADLMPQIFPVTRLLAIRNPLQKLCAFAALIPAGLQFLSRIYYDVFFYGLPTDLAEWLLLVTYYIGDLAALVIGYLVLLYVLQMLFASETKSRISFES